MKYLAPCPLLLFGLLATAQNLSSVPVKFGCVSGKGVIKDKNGAIINSGDCAADTMMHAEQSSVAKKIAFEAWIMPDPAII